MEDAENRCEKNAVSVEDSPLARRILQEGLAIQDRFAAAPVYAKTGKGYLKSVGVSEVAEAKRIARTNAGK